MKIDKSSISHTAWNCKYHIVFTPKLKSFRISAKGFLRPNALIFFMAFAYNEDRATQRCDSSAL